MTQTKINAQSQKAKKRIAWIDIAKGIAILLVILGHCVSSGPCGSALRGIIFSFHMPLFFILSCVTYKMSKDNDELKAKTKKAFRHLVIPAIILFALITIRQCITGEASFLSKEFWIGKAYTLIFASGTSSDFFGASVAPTGIPWFFFALFIGRTIFDFLHLSTKDDNKLLILSLLAGMLGVFGGQIQHLPFSIDVALAIQPFFYYGYYLKHHSAEKNTFKKMLISCAVWLVALLFTFPNYNAWTYLELAGRRYPLFPICYIAAIAGTMLVAELSVYIEKLKTLSKPLIYLGKNSLYLLCIHTLDGAFINIWMVEGHQFITAAKRLIFNLLIFAVFMSIKFAIFKKKHDNKKQQK